MNKEEAKNQVLSILKGFDHLGQYGVLQIIDQIEPDHPKVELARRVGEEIDTWIANNQDGYGCTIRDFCGDLRDCYHALLLAVAFGEKSEENFFKLIDAYRYGWMEEKTKRYVLPMDGTEDAHGYVQYLYRYQGEWHVSDNNSREVAERNAGVSEEDLAERPEWAMEIKPVEVHSG